MKTRTKYVCEFCDQEFSTEGEARYCENRGVPEESHLIEEGDELIFTREEKEEGRVITYSKEKGTVLHKIGTFDDQERRHKHIVIVATPDGQERGVVYTNQENEEDRWIGPVMYAWKPGFTERIKQIKL